MASVPNDAGRASELTQEGLQFEGLKQAIVVDTEKVRGHLDEVVRSTVEATLNQLLDEEADRIAGAGKYERTAERKDTRAGSYQRKLQTKAGEVQLTVPRLRKLPFETASWRNFLRHLKERGLTGVQLFISDKCLGLVESLGEFYPDAAWQRCVVHWYRNVMTGVPTGKVREVVAMLKAIHAQEDQESARQKAAQVEEKLTAMKLSAAAKIVREGIEETLSYMAFPREHWRGLRTNNPLERLNREVRRRTRVVGAFPDGQSALMLVAARLRHVAGTKWGARRYVDMSKLREMTIAKMNNEPAQAAVA